MFRPSILLLCVMAVAFASPKSSPIDGKWYFHGSAGWQRIEFDFNVSGKSLNGTITMGPGVRGTSGSEDWEYFFEPATFPIQHGTFDGTIVTFQQEVARGAQTQPNELLTYTGRFDGDRIDFTRESSQRIVGKCNRPPEYCIKDAFVLGDHKIAFVAQRADTPVSGPARPPLDTSAIDHGVRNLNSAPIESPAHVLLVFDHNQTWFEDSTTERDSEKYGLAEWTALLSSVRGFLSRLRSSDSMAIADMENSAQFCLFRRQKVPCSFYTALDWMPAKAGKTDITLDLTKAFPGQKDLYGAIEQTTRLFYGIGDRKIAVFFTDGRDGRLSPRWLRTVAPIRVVTLDTTLPTPGVPRKQRFPQNYKDVLDPLFGLPDSAENAEFDKVVASAAESGIEFYFITIHSGRDPEFGPALVGRRISGLFPGSNQAIDGYIAQTRLRLEKLAQATGGRVIHGETPNDAVSAYQSLDQILGLRRSESGRER